MNCPNCNHQNIESAVFCQNCGARLVGGGIGSGSSRSGRTISITPKDIGGILSETFSVYRAYFLAFFAIAFIAQVPFIVLAGTAPEFFFPLAAPNENPELPSGGTVLSLLVLALIAIVLGLATWGAMVNGVVQHYLTGRVDIGQALGKGMEKLLYLIGALLLLIAILIIPALLSIILIGIPILIFLIVRLYFSFQAIMLEGRGPVESLSRSWNLVQDSWWRTFGIALVFILLTIGVSVIASLIVSPLTTANAFIGSVISSAINALIAPISVIGATLLYFDLRVRKEGNPVVIQA